MQWVPFSKTGMVNICFLVYKKMKNKCFHLENGSWGKKYYVSLYYEENNFGNLLELSLMAIASGHRY